jgi:hypothetical protein
VQVIADGTLGHALVDGDLRGRDAGSIHLDEFGVRCPETAPFHRVITPDCGLSPVSGSRKCAVELECSPPVLSEVQLRQRRELQGGTPKSGSI